MTLSRRHVLLGLVGTVIAPSKQAHASVSAFELGDQWERTISSATIFRSTVVIVGGDQRSTADRIGEWAVKLSGLAVYGIADLQSLPFFVPKGSVRGATRTSAPKTPVLLDWKGAVYAPILAFPKGKEVVVQVYGADGKLLRRIEGPVDPSRIQEVRVAATAPPDSGVPR